MVQELERSSLWTRMRFLLDCLGSKFDSGSFLDECLDLLGDLTGAEQGLVCAPSSSRGWNTIAGRTQRRPLRKDDAADLPSALLDDALRAGRRIVISMQPPGQGRRGGHSIIAVPLRRGAWHRSGGGTRTLGVICLLLDEPEPNLDPLRVEFLESAAVLVAVTLDQRLRLEAAEENLRAVKSRETIDEGPNLEEILDSPALSTLRPDAEACVVGQSSVMILGESGTGKTRLAAAIARRSGRTPIVRATLGASDDLNTITSELFGHERGAFSGAVSKRTGLVEYADGGTLILDEVLNLPPHAQQLLLDFTQFGTYRPLGYQGKEPKQANVRIISATNGNIRQAIVDTRFRQDLYFRLAGVTLVLPPLRHRRSEIPDLAQRFLSRLDASGSWRLSTASRRLLLSEGWEWEGNIRQLQGVIRRARDRAVASGVDTKGIEPHHIGHPTNAVPTIGGLIPSSPPPPPPSQEPQTSACDPDEDEPGSVEDRWTNLQTKRSGLDDLERQLIDQAMRENRGVVAHAARRLQISRTSLLSRMVTLQIDKDIYRR